MTDTTLQHIPHVPHAGFDRPRDIEGALGTIRPGGDRSRTGWKARLATLLAILGPGLIVMVGDNDAGAFGTYTQAGQNYGTTLLWTLPLLIPVLYVNQEMALRLGAVTGIGHARLILERFGRLWGAFSVIDLFVLNGLTIVTEFIGIDLALRYLGVPRAGGIPIAALVVVGAASTGSFRRFERFSLTLCALSLLLVPVFLMAHPPLGAIGRGLVLPLLPTGGKLSDVVLLIIGIVGTTIAPWQLFFQQSYVIDKRITSRFIAYERWDLVLGIGLVVVGAVAMIACAAAAFEGTAAFGQYSDAGAVARGLQAHAGRAAGVMFALALLDASIIGASAVSLSTAYAVGDVLALRHSLHHRAIDTRGFLAVHGGLVAIAAALVLVGSDALLGLLTNAVQVLAGVLLPSATVFLLLLCNDRAVLGPWANGRGLNLFTGAVIWVLVMLSLVLTASTVFPDLGGDVIVALLAAGAVAGLAGAAFACRRASPGVAAPVPATDRTRADWRMRPLRELPRPPLTRAHRAWMGVLRGYLAIAVVLVVVKIVRIAAGS